MSLKIFQISLIGLLMVSTPVAMADTSKLGVEFIGNYSQTSDPIQINGKSFTFKTGSIGLRGTMDYDEYGKVFLQYGVAYSPSESANFIDAKLSGSISVQSIGYGYIYPYDIASTPWSVDFKLDRTTSKHTGDNFSGTYNSHAATASVSATSEFTRAGVAFNYQLSDNVVLTVGAGSYRWDIEAEAKGNLDIGTTTFTTDLKDANGASPSGTDGFYFVESIFPLLDRETKLGFRRSSLNTDINNTLNEIYVEIPMDFY